MIPDWWHFFLLAFASYRIWRLLAEDDVLERPRRWVLQLGDWREEGDPYPDGYREKWALFLTCPWCAGGWISLLAYTGWLWVFGAWPDTAAEVATGVAVWFAISASVGIIRGQLDPPEE